jgi:hypothetical protein
VKDDGFVADIPFPHLIPPRPRSKMSSPAASVPWASSPLSSKGTQSPGLETETEIEGVRLSKGIPSVLDSAFGL